MNWSGSSILVKVSVKGSIHSGIGIEEFVQVLNHSIIIYQFGTNLQALHGRWRTDAVNGNSFLFEGRMKDFLVC